MIFGHSKHACQLLANLIIFKFHVKMENLQRGLSFGKEPFWHENFLIFKSAYILYAYSRWLKIKFHYGTSISNGQIKLKVQFLSLLCKWWTKYFSTSFDYYFKGLTWWNFNFWSFLTWMPNLCRFRKFNFHVKTANF